MDHYPEFSVYEYNKGSKVLDKPLYLGLSVSQLSKVLMYECYHDEVLAHWGKQVQLHHLDTDSIILSIKTENLIKDLEYFKDNFDFSELDKLYDCKN